MMGAYKYRIERVEKFLSQLYWSNINIHSGFYGRIAVAESIKVYEPHIDSRPLISEIVTSQPGDLHFVDTVVGTSFGPSWSTKWFKVSFVVSKYFHRKKIGLRWDSDSEAMLYSGQFSDGYSYLQSFTGGGGSDRRDLYPIPGTAVAGDRLEFYVEMACNGMFGNGNNGMIRAPNPNRTFTLLACELVEIHEQAMELYWDMTVLYELGKTLPETNPVGT
jgi:alpha-mannosidase